MSKDYSALNKKELQKKLEELEAKATKRAIVTIKTGKHDNTNPALWRVAATYGVIKGPIGKNSKGQDLRIADRVHWSASGK